MYSRFMKIGAVQSAVSLSKTELYRRIAAGTFPKPVRLGPQRVAFLEKDVENWILARIAGGQENEI